MADMGLIAPHGGVLINRVTEGTAPGRYEESGPAIVLSERAQCDLEMIAVGGMSPLTGFVGRKDYESICKTMRLADGTTWPFPITCSVDQPTADGLSIGNRIALLDDQRRLLGFLTIEEIYPHDKVQQAENVFKTTETAHPGVKVLMAEADVCLAGPIDVVCPRYDAEFSEFRLTPAQTRAAFEQRGWKTVVGFQTRNPIHRAHEYITKSALEICDGLLIHPLIGQTQAGDIPADVRMNCYTALIDKYYVGDRTMLAVLPAAMRYAGPREALLHALLRQNFGCSHLVIGRDHAGVGDYYGPFDAHDIFDELAPGSLETVPLKLGVTFYCDSCGGTATDRTCPHDEDHRLAISGTRLRAMFANHEPIPPEFSRPEVLEILQAHYDSLG
ncbi:MAG: sulfate adenylyltransferase [Proteobacteria bacterium]|nr:sulfate adenylyltransferase [Pseudomonadota bacterium]